jgi:two-component system, OmpR family, phosphate regulon sensor histidine kinase PhoR
MTQSKIRWIIGFMTLALVGLIAFQAYWLGFMLETKKEQFAADVTDGLAQVVRKLEKQELVMLAQRHSSFETQQQKLKELSSELAARKNTIFVPPPPPPERNIAENFIGPEVASKNNLGPIHNEVRSDIMYVRKSFMLPNGQIAEITEEYRVDVDPEQDLQRRMEEDRQLSDMLGEMPRERKMKRKINRLKRELNNKIRKEPLTKKELRQVGNAVNEFAKNELDKVIKKTALAKEVFADYLFKERPIAQRVEPHYIDSLLRKELAAKHIDLAYQFGIAPAAPKQASEWIFASNPIIKKQKPQYLAALYPNDLHASGQFLHVNFSDTDGFIWQTMGLSLLGSGVLLFIMIGCFYIAMMTIIKQKKLAEIKNDFINNMTHEFKTPISTISLATQLIQEEPQAAKSESILRYLGIIKDENIRLGQQVERVLQTAQMEREEIVLKKKSTDLHALIQQVADMNAPLLHTNQGALDLDLAADQYQLFVDEVHITNVLNNLLDNAIKYSPDSPQVNIRTRSDSQGFHILVSDQGMGMQKEVLSAVFEPFYRVPTGNVHNVKGFGLGLSYVKKIVEAHGGQVHVSSKLGEGSTFEITIPYGTND